jgi:rhomboid family protein
MPRISKAMGAGARGASDWLRGLRQAPATFAWLGALSLTRLVLIFGSESFDNRLLLGASTNLHNLARQPVRALAASPFFVTSNRNYLGFAATCFILLAPLERRIGSRRWLAGAVLGHVGTSLLVAAGLALVAPGSDGADAIDVGPSYAARFLIALYVCLLRGRTRRPAAALLVTLSILQLVLGRSYTDWGHLLAVTLGLALGSVLLGRKPTPWKPPSALHTRHEG